MSEQDKIEILEMRIVALKEQVEHWRHKSDETQRTTDAVIVYYKIVQWVLFLVIVGLLVVMKIN